MKFEEALALLREGAKIWHPMFAEDEYLSGCYIGFPDYYDDNGNLVTETLEQKKERGMSIVKIKGDRQSDEMAGVSYWVVKIKRHLKNILSEEDYKKYHNIYTEMDIAKIFDNDIFKFPQLNLLLIMSDEWKVIGGIL